VHETIIFAAIHRGVIEWRDRQIYNDVNYAHKGSGPRDQRKYFFVIASIIPNKIETGIDYNDKDCKQAVPVPDIVKKTGEEQPNPAGKKNDGKRLAPPDLCKRGLDAEDNDSPKEQDKNNPPRRFFHRNIGVKYRSDTQGENAHHDQETNKCQPISSLLRNTLCDAEYFIENKNIYSL
jgi:hypothetical protein